MQLIFTGGVHINPEAIEYIQPGSSNGPNECVIHLRSGQTITVGSPASEVVGNLFPQEPKSV